MALVAAVMLAATSHGMVDPLGKPLGYDFITFWSASDLTLHGKPEAAFDAAQITAVQRQAVAGSSVDFYWHYPPTFQLAAAPLSLLPYGLSFLVFVSLGFAAYLLAMRPLLDQPHAGLLLAAFPAALLCAYHGQNSLFSTALLAGAVYFSERGSRGALLAGACIGLLAYKPQLGVLAPLALMAAGRWLTFMAAAATAIAFAALATLVFGVDLWSAFVGDLSFVRELVESGALPWAKMPSAWVFLRYFGVTEAAAYAVQTGVIVCAAATVIYVWRRCGMTRLSWATLVSATLLVPYYIFDYELALLAIPLAILISDMAQRGATRNEKLAVLAFAVLSGVTAPISSAIHVQIGFPLLAGVLWLTTRRALRSADATARPLLPWRRAERAA
jgi:hypothetical protein